jgi:hypothetical protein
MRAVVTQAQRPQKKGDNVFFILQASRTKRLPFIENNLRIYVQNPEIHLPEADSGA